MGPPYDKRDPYYSHTIPISLGILMGVGLGNSMGPAYHKGGVPENPIDMLGDPTRHF